MRDVGTWSWQTWLCAVVLVLCCVPGIGLCMYACLAVPRIGLLAEMGSLLNPRGYALLDLEGEEDIPRILRREMRLA